MLDHVIVGQPFDGRPGYFSFKEAGYSSLCASKFCPNRSDFEILEPYA